MRTLHNLNWPRTRLALPLYDLGDDRGRCISSEFGKGTPRYPANIWRHISQGLLKLREPGFRAVTRSQLRAELKQHAKGKGVAAWEADAGMKNDENIYALFQTTTDPEWASENWRGDELMT